MESYFDDNSNRTAILYPGGRTIDYGYDALNRQTGIVESPTNLATCFYQGFKPRQTDLANGLSCNINYGLGEEIIQCLDAPTGGGTAIVDFLYGHDGVYNRLYEERVHDGVGEKYAYDSTYRLTETLYDIPNPATSTSGQKVRETFIYDELDRRDVVDLDVASVRPPFDTAGPQSLYYEPNLLSEYLEIDDTAGLQSADRSYDLNGNLIQDETYDYEFDALNRLIRVQRIDNTERVTFEYDANGRRTAKVVENPISTVVLDELYYCSGAEVIEERDAATESVQRTYVLSNRLDHPLQMREGASEYYYHQNSLGSVYKLSNAAGAVAEEYAYDSYGRSSILLDDGNCENPYRFTGRRLDPESGLHYYRARYQQPETGTFLSRDPMGYVDSASVFVYVSDNPVNSIDPWGLDDKDRLESILSDIQDAYARIDDFQRKRDSQPSYYFITRHYFQSAIYGAEAEIAVLRQELIGNYQFRSQLLGAIDDLWVGTTAETGKFGAATLLGGPILGAGGYALSKTPFGRIAGAMAAETLERIAKRSRGLLRRNCDKLDDFAVFAQGDFGEAFSKLGADELFKLTGYQVKTIDDLAGLIRSGAVDPDIIPVNFLVSDGQQIILNTRTARALRRAGIPRSEWNAINQTSDEFFWGLFEGQQSRNYHALYPNPVFRDLME